MSNAAQIRAVIAQVFARAHANAPFLAGLIDRHPALVTALEQGAIDLAPPFDPAEPVARQLRQTRMRLALTVAIGDLAGLLDLAAVTAALTDFADRALDRAITAAIAERTPGAQATGFVALALGKQGSRELNYSSDIDPILLFDPNTLPRRAREEPEDAAVRIARRVVELLQSRDGDGYALRVDLRLRPSPEVTPLALSIGAAASYYESQALPWERAAFIRARAVAGDIALGERFLETIRPFVWRRGLDFGAVAEIRGISRRIRDHYSAGQVFGPGYDLKRGRGGIREVEFYAQIHQLIHGGRDPALRAPATRDALAALAHAGWIDADDAAALSASYTMLRTIEHRVQMIDDRQTHALPHCEALDGVARLHGLGDGDELLALLRPHVEATARIYDALDAGAPAMLPDDPVTLAGSLAESGLTDVDAARARIETWRGGRYPALRSAAAREALEVALPTLIAAIARAPAPAAAMLRLDALLERLPSALNLFRLLGARPAVTELLMAILSHAPTLADALAQRPALLDGLLDASALKPVGSVEALAAAMTGSEDYGVQLDRVRLFVGEARFALGTQIVAGKAGPLDVAAGYARVAEAAIAVLGRATIAEFERAHGCVPGGELVILALGRLGGRALTHASDLDLIYLFTGAFTATSDGERPLGATLYFNRLAQRITGALTVGTAAGPLYPIDTRLRPSGNKGPLAVSLDSFERYNREEAWTWEHMALTRARPVFGSPEARGDVAKIVADVLHGGRQSHDIATDARAMRADMTRHKPPLGPLDAKRLPGGLIDLEFTVHVAQLTHCTGLDPHLGSAIDALIAAGLLRPALREAHDLLTRLLVTLRLVTPDAQEPPLATQALIAAAMGLPGWPAVLASFAAARQEVASEWARIGKSDG